MMVSARPKMRFERSLFLSAQCAQVTVTPEESSSSVLIAGMPHACMAVNSGGRYGPVVGQCDAKSGQSSLLSRSPSHGTEYCARVEERAEERREEHHFREDEPAHRPAEGHGPPGC